MGVLGGSLPNLQPGPSGFIRQPFGFQLETVKVNCADPAWPENQSGITTARGMDVFQGDSRSWSYPFVGLVSRTFIAAMRS